MGSIIGMVRTASDSPSVSASLAPASRWPSAPSAHGCRAPDRIRRQRRRRLRAGRSQRAVDDAAVLHVRRQQAQRHLPDLVPGYLVAVAEHAVRRGQQPIVFVVKRDRCALCRAARFRGRSGPHRPRDFPAGQAPRSRCRTRCESARSGCRARNGVVSEATMPSAVGIAAMPISPERPSLSALISCRIARASPTMRRAQSSVRSPSGVKPWNREPRCTSMTPRISSSCFRLVDIVGWVTPQASAARPK